MARCPACGGIVPTGSNCQVEDSECFSWSGDGAPYTASPILSVAAGQLLICSASGLLAEVPASLSEPPVAQTYNSTNLPIANNTLTTLTMNTELYDTDSMHSVSSNTGRITFTTAGTYIVTLNCTWNKNATGDRLAQIRKNGADILAYESKKTGGADLLVGHSITIEDVFVATDYVEARVQQNSGASLNILTPPTFSAARMA